MGRASYQYSKEESLTSSGGAFFLSPGIVVNWLGGNFRVW